MQNGEQPIRLPSSLLYPRVEVEQRTHSGHEIGDSSWSKILQNVDTSHDMTVWVTIFRQFIDDILTRDAELRLCSHDTVMKLLGIGLPFTWKWNIFRQHILKMV